MGILCRCSGASVYCGAGSNLECMGVCLPCDMRSLMRAVHAQPMEGHRGMLIIVQQSYGGAEPAGKPRLMQSSCIWRKGRDCSLWHTLRGAHALLPVGTAWVHDRCAGSIAGLAAGSPLCACPGRGVLGWGLLCACPLPPCGWGRRIWPSEYPQTGTSQQRWICSACAASACRARSGRPGTPGSWERTNLVIPPARET